MSRNGSGTYNLPAGNPVVSGTTITTTWANTTLNDIASALTGSVSADGQTPMTGALNMASNKIIAVTDPTNAQDAATKNYTDAAVAASVAGLGTMSTQNANAVAITGGTITGASLNANDLSSGTIGYARLPAGNILQVVQATNTSQITSTSTSYVTTGVSASITPKFSTSKIIAFVTCANVYAQAQANYFTLYRNATNLATASNIGQLYCNTANVLTNVNFNVLDAPSTTSATTYTIYFYASSGTVFINQGNTGLTTITLMEIAQ